MTYQPHQSEDGTTKPVAGSVHPAAPGIDQDFRAGSALSTAASCGPLWVHDTCPIWVSFYPEVEGVRPAHFIPYRAIEPVPAGRKPWTVNNRRIGSDRGFGSLDAAIAKALGTPDSASGSPSRSEARPDEKNQTGDLS